MRGGDGVSERLQGHPECGQGTRPVVAWSDEDQALIGYCPALFVGGVCHDENRIAAYAKLVEIVEEDIQSRLE